jgi:enoyl-CoA hydratase/carnithine racemase
MSQLPHLSDASLTLEDRVAVLTFERHDVRNALTGTELVSDIVKAMHWANRDQAVSVMIITAAGSAFSAGGNIKEMRDRQGTFAGSVLDIQQRYRESIQQISLTVPNAEIPLIAAINGAAVGAGLDLACMCDLRIGSTQAVLGETFINLGLIPGDGGAWFLQRLIGYQKAAEMTFTGRLVKAAEAQTMGLLLEVVEPERLLPRAKEMAAEIAAKPPQTIRFTKRLLKLAQRQELPEFLDLCASFQGMCHHTDDHIEALNAFLEKRIGNYTGQ